MITVIEKGNANYTFLIYLGFNMTRFYIRLEGYRLNVGLHRMRPFLNIGKIRFMKDGKLVDYKDVKKDLAGI
jgi:hypothetical protein